MTSSISVISSMSRAKLLLSLVEASTSSVLMREVLIMNRKWDWLDGRMFSLRRELA